MKQIAITIKEKDKGDKQLTLLNLRDEIVNYLYKETVANSTKSDQQFFVLVYFASLKAGDKSFIEALFDAALPRFDNLLKAFKSKTGYLARSEYRQLVNANGLEDFFKGDIFFVLSEAIMNLENIEHKFKDAYESDPNLRQVISRLKKDYAPQIKLHMEVFSGSKIQDDRYDEDGNYHDLSKSVYRTIRMRNSRNLELNIQKYTTIKNITSRSPLIIDFIQLVDPQIMFDLWDKYRVVDYYQGVVRFVENSPTTSGTVAGIISGIIIKYTSWKNINGAEERQRKNRAKAELETAKTQHNETLEKINQRLVESILSSNERLRDEIASTRAELNVQRASVSRDKDEIKKLEKRIAKLDNLKVEFPEDTPEI